MTVCLDLIQLWCELGWFLLIQSQIAIYDCVINYSDWVRKVIM